MSKVAIAGDSIISALGFGTSENVERMLDGEGGIRRYENAQLYPQPFLAAMVDNQRLGKLAKEAEIEGYSRIEQLFILSIQDAVKGLNVDFSQPDVQLVLATTKGTIEAIKGATVPTEDAYLWKMAGNVAAYFGSANEPIVISNACISGVLAVEHGAKLVRSGRYKTVVVAGADTVSEFVIAGFASFKSLSSEPCKPYDVLRDGLSLGEGCAAMVLTADSTQGKPTYILGGGCSNDANHISGPSRTGDGLYYAMKEAIESSYIEPNDIGWLVTHATATPFNDEMECKAINLMGLQHVATTGLKGFVGHTLAASGIIELVVAAEAMRRGYLLGTKGFDRLGGVTQPLNVLAEARKEKVEYCLKTASGFGGCNAALVLSNGIPNQQLAEEKAIKGSVECISHVRIQPSTVSANGKVMYADDTSAPFPDFIRGCYKNLRLAYPKFYKMDDLCKLGLTAVEYLLQGIDMQPYQPSEVGVMLFTSSSSLDTDLKFQQRIDEQGADEASPSVFVYTLANIMAGEVAIKHKLQGRSIVYVRQRFDKEIMQAQAQEWLSTGRLKLCIAGWVDLLQNDYAADLYLFKK